MKLLGKSNWYSLINPLGLKFGVFKVRTSEGLKCHWFLTRLLTIFPIIKSLFILASPSLAKVLLSSGFPPFELSPGVPHASCTSFLSSATKNSMYHASFHVVSPIRDVSSECVREVIG